MATATESKHTPGAVRAATVLARLSRQAARAAGARMPTSNDVPQAQIDGFAMIIDRETAAPAMLEALVQLNTELNLDALANHFPVAEAVVGKIKAAIRLAKGEE